MAHRFSSISTLVGTAVVFVALSASADDTRVAAVKPEPPRKAGGYYVQNRAPLQPTLFMKLPIGSITPKGWLRRQLELDASGLVGQMPQLSDYLKYEGNGWVDPQGKAGWEELTYWLRGYGDLGYVLKNKKIISEAARWMNGVLTSQRADGWFGPEAARTSLDGGPDLWPHMPMLNALRSYYEVSHDPRVIPFLMKFFRYQDTLPPDTYKRGWGAVRWGDNIDTVYWLYNRTGEPWLLELARKNHEHSADYTGGIPTWHNVNLAQGIREPAEYWQQSRDSKFLRATYRDYDTVMGLYGQFPGGGFAGDENCRPGYADPRQGFETCGWVEFMHTFEMMTRISGDPLWADRCEEIAFNSYPAALDPDHRGTHYITSANSIQLDNTGKRHNQFANGTFPMQAFMPGIHNYRCCPHNLGMGWPYYAEELWLATADKGLCASLYAASDVTAKVGDGTTATLTEKTDYPFDDAIQLRVTVPKSVRFPLYLRVPRWCANASVQINGRRYAAKATPLTYLAIDRTWKSGDTVTLRLPMKLHVRTWVKNKGSVSVDYGPLTFSLAIQESWKKIKGPDAWPAYEVRPGSAWNYGLALDPRNPEKSLTVVRKSGAVPSQPFTPDAVPIEIYASARKIPGWQADSDNVIGVLQASPARTGKPIEKVRLIPMGAARLRIASFPTVATGPGAHDWSATAAAWPKVTASHVFDSPDAIKGGSAPSGSADQTVPRFTWWDHRGTAEWIQYEFQKPRTVSAVSVYWFDDTGVGLCRTPQSWRLLYRDGGSWKPVEGASSFGTARDGFNRVTFPPIDTSALRIEVQLQPEKSSGVLLWKVER
jgi:hypothetical protein